MDQEKQEVVSSKATTVWPFNLDTVNNWAFWNGAFSKPECEEIINIGKKSFRYKAVVGNNVIDESIRDSKVGWIYPDQENAWLFRRVTDIITQLNRDYYGFDLYGMIEGFQFTEYTAPGQKYGKHVDASVGGWVRKMSFVLQLSDPSEYTGGELKLFFGDNPEVISKDQGYVAVFPSYVLHEVTPVTEGTRYSLVCWVTGPSFK